MTCMVVRQKDTGRQLRVYHYDFPVENSKDRERAKRLACELAQSLRDAGKAHFIVEDYFMGSSTLVFDTERG